MFGHADGFAIAAGITAWGEVQGQTEDPSYGELKFFQHAWDYEDHITKPFQELKTNLCEASELNDIDGSNEASHFYKTSVDVG